MLNDAATIRSKCQDFKSKSIVDKITLIRLRDVLTDAKYEKKTAKEVGREVVVRLRKAISSCVFKLHEHSILGVSLSWFDGSDIKERSVRLGERPNDPYYCDTVARQLDRIEGEINVHNTALNVFANYHLDNLAGLVEDYLKAHDALKQFVDQYQAEHRHLVLMLLKELDITAIQKRIVKHD